MPRKTLVSARMSAAQLSALAPTGEEFDIADPAVAGLVLRVGPTGTKRFVFDLAAQNASLTGTVNPVPVTLTIGNNSGTTSVTAAILPALATAH